MLKVLDTVKIREVVFTVGMSADEVVYYSRKNFIEPISAAQVGTDENGLVVEWKYPGDVTFTFKRTSVNGAISYRIAKIEDIS